MYKMEYQFIVGNQPSDVHARVNELAEQSWGIQVAYGIPDHRGMVHAVWMWRSVKVDDASH